MPTVSHPECNKNEDNDLTINKNNSLDNEQNISTEDV